MSDSLTTTWTVAHQAPLSMGFSRQEHWNGLPFPSLGDLPDLEIEPASPALTGGFFTTETVNEGVMCNYVRLIHRRRLPSAVLGPYCAGEHRASERDLFMWELRRSFLSCTCRKPGIK